MKIEMSRFCAAGVMRHALESVDAWIDAVTTRFFQSSVTGEFHGLKTGDLKNFLTNCVNIFSMCCYRF